MSRLAKQDKRIGSSSLPRARFIEGCSLRHGSISVPVLLLVIVLASVATVLCYRAVHSRLSTELRAGVHRELCELFPKADIFVGRVAFDDRGTIVVNDLRMAAKASGARRPIVTAERVYIRGQFDISDFLKQTAGVEQIQLVGLQLDAWPMEDGSWSFERIKPQPKQKRTPPEMQIERSSVRIRQSAEEKSPEVVLHDVEATVRVVASHCRLSSQVDSHQDIVHQFEIGASGKSSGLLADLNVQCSLDSTMQLIEILGDATGLHFSQRLLDLLPTNIAKKLTQLSGLECEASCSNFHILCGVGRDTEFSCQGDISAGRLKDSRLPYPLERISGGFFCKNSLLQLRNTSARSGGASLRIDTDIMGLGLESPMVVQAQIQNLDLDQRLYASLPHPLQQQWDRMQLTGRISGNIELRFDGSAWQQSATIDCQQVGVRPWLFPYPFSNVEGQILYRNGTIHSEQLLGRAGGQLVEAKFQLRDVDKQWLGKIQCRSHGAVVIDEELVSSLTATGEATSGAESFIRTLHPAGGIELVNATFERTDTHSPEWNRELDIHVYDGRLQYDSFRYPIYNIRGRIVNRDHDWHLESFEGRNDSARILFAGQWKQVKLGPIPFQLQFDAHTVPLAEDLFLAVPQQVRNVWSHLQPSGTIGHIAAVIGRKAGEEDVHTHVTITEQNDAGSQPGRSLRLYPHLFPYHLNDVNCHVVYSDGALAIQRATAQNGATRFALRGECRSRPDGSWQGDIQWLPTTRLMLEGHFLKALPKDIQESLQKLNFQGPVSVLGRSQVVFGDLESRPELDWDCQFDIEDGQLAGGEYVGAMRGTVWARGTNRSGQLFATGQVSMDALRVMKIPVTKLQGPFVLSENKLYFGESTQKAGLAANPLDASEMTAQTLAGSLRLSGHSFLESGKVNLDAALENADLSTLLLELGVPLQESQAVCNVSLKDFRGIPWSPQTYHGHGSIQLSNAKLYELPFMMRLLSVASVSANDASAFQRADIDFRIDGDHIPLKVSADGEVLRVRGEGWTNLRRDVNLQLYTYVGRRMPMGQVVSPLLAESRFATFMMVEVNGSLDNPTMQRRPFPQIESTLQQIFPEVAEQRPFRDAINRWRN